MRLVIPQTIARQLCFENETFFCLKIITGIRQIRTRFSSVQKKPLFSCTSWFADPGFLSPHTSVLALQNVWLWSVTFLTRTVSNELPVCDFCIYYSCAN